MSTNQHTDLQGMKALVTGATTGLGRAIAMQLARDGAEVVVHGRDAARSPADLKRLTEESGEIDILVNNAGDYTFGPTAHFDMATFDPSGVRVNTVAAGPIYTRPDERELYDTVCATTALKRAAQPAEIAEVVALLASPRASYVTGALVAADGGRTAI